MCTQELPLPDGVEVVHASPAAGHLSSASIYPACFAPYIIVTACSDSTVRFVSLSYLKNQISSQCHIMFVFEFLSFIVSFRFWKCKVTKSNGSKKNYEWCEWEMLRKDQESTIDITGMLF